MCRSTCGVIVLAGQGRAGRGGGRGVLGEPCRRRRGSAAAVSGGEQRIGRVRRRFGEPDPQHRDGAGGQRGDAFLASLALAARRGPRRRGGHPRRSARSARRPAARFGSARTAGRGRGARSRWRGRGGEQRVDLGLGEEGDECGGRSVWAGSPGPGAMSCGVFGVAQRREPEQRVDRGQPGVAGADAVAALVSRWSRNAPISGASRSARSSSEGGLPVRSAAKPSSSRSVSR